MIFDFPAIGRRLIYLARDKRIHAFYMEGKGRHKRAAGGRTGIEPIYRSATSRNPSGRAPVFENAPPVGRLKAPLVRALPACRSD